MISALSLQKAMPSLVESARNIQQFENDSLRNRLSNLENVFEGIDKQGSQTLVSTQNITPSLLDSAFVLKRAAGQINVIVHAVGILVALPHILKEGEVVHSLSLGAGNTGKAFDLETNWRVAEFKFIQWRGGSEAIRQNSIFKDFYWLAETKTSKERCLYVVGLTYPLKFFTGGRALSSVMSRNNKLWTDFQRRYGSRFTKVCDYYEYRKALVQIVDILEAVPEMADLLK